MRRIMDIFPNIRMLFNDTAFAYFPGYFCNVVDILELLRTIGTTYRSVNTNSVFYYEKE